MTVFEVKCVFWSVDWNWRLDKSIRKVFTWFVCVLMVWSDWGWSLGEGANFYFSFGTKNWGFLALSGTESSLVKTFCESCVQLDITHPSVHMTQRFVIQGCPTLNPACSFPSQWEYWMLTPILKSSVKNYRPISLLSLVSKVLEWIVYSRVSKHLQTHHLATL